MGSQTTTYKRTLSGSIGAGMGSLFAPGGKKYYILEHKINGGYHRAGESQEIIVDNIELGRDSHCQVRFDERFKTVSRRHAAIVREGDMWKLVPISKNATLLNGRALKQEWYLQNGDEIQLSVNGPKLGFIVPTGKKSTVGSIGLTRRLSLFRQQALRPYKTAITVLSCFLVLAVGGLTTWNYMLRNDFMKQGELLAQQIEESENNKAKAEELAKKLVENNKKIEGHEATIKKLKAETERAWKAAAEAKKMADNAVTTNAPEELSVCYPYVYYINIFIYIDGKMQDSYFTGTGFLLKDGRFVTAQHVVNLWEGMGSEFEQYLNLCAHNGVDLKFKMVATSRSGDKIEMDYTPISNPFKWGKYNLKTSTVTLDNGVQAVVKYRTETTDFRDYAYVAVNKQGGLDFEVEASSTLPAKTHLDILGFPQSVGAENTQKITPIYSESTVAREGLDTDGCILLSNNETDHGNSGGPVLIYKNGYKVVGILSGANRLGSKTKRSTDGIWKTRVVPISAMK